VTASSKKMEERFEDRSSIHSFKILDFQFIKSQSEEDLNLYGDDEMDNLIQFCGMRKKVQNVWHFPLINPGDTRQEWQNLKFFAKVNIGS